MADRWRARDRLLEVVAVVLLGVATVGTAWCALQSSLWSGESDRVTASAASQRVEANRLFGVATQALSYDASMVSDYAQAVATGNEKLQLFYRQVLVRSGFRPFLDEWEKDVAEGKLPPNLLEDEEYVSGLMAPYQQKLAEADASSDRAQAAGRTSDLYVLTTVLLAVSLFFAGVTASFRSPTMRVLLLVGGLATLAVATGHLIDLPVAAGTFSLFGLN
ncbi:MAG: hypothetical protein AAGC63_04230 [Propionicimonas sp.]|nr:hypothetical protein [Propionicimonas sp.]